jgi:hypothetical protein
VCVCMCLCVCVHVFVSAFVHACVHAYVCMNVLITDIVMEDRIVVRETEKLADGKCLCTRLKFTKNTFRVFHYTC